MQEHIHFWVIEKKRKEFFKIKLMIKNWKWKTFFFFFNPNRKFFSSWCFYISVPFYKCEETQKASKKTHWVRNLQKQIHFHFKFSLWELNFRFWTCFWSQNKSIFLNCNGKPWNGKLIKENSKVFGKINKSFRCGCEWVKEFDMYFAICGSSYWVKWEYSILLGKFYKFS